MRFYKMGACKLQTKLSAGRYACKLRALTICTFFQIRK